jgi:hypothetical protein
MKTNKRGRHERVDCKHRRKQTSRLAGMQRNVCQKCGNVSVNYLFDVFAEEQLQLDTYPSQS